jgi:hypothetical protein
MKTLISSIKTLHLILIFLSLCTLSLLPLLLNAEIITNLIYLPIGYILLGIISFNIENKLNKYQEVINNQEQQFNNKKCLIYRGICCLHS